MSHNYTISRYILVGLGVAFCVYAIIAGAILPLRRSQLFIKALQNARYAKTVDQLKKVMEVPLNHSSPVGEQEVVKFFANDVIGLARNQSEDVAHAIVTFFDPYLMKYNYDLRLMLQRGYIYADLWRRFKKDEYYVRAEESLRIAYTLGPKVPRAVYSLMSLYMERGDIRGMKEIGGAILNYWPSDAEVQKLLQDVAKAEAAARTKK